MATDMGMYKEASMGSADVHKSLSLAMEEAKWYIAECKPTRERVVRAMLQKVGYEAYVAGQAETRVYKSRNKRIVERILLPGKVFVRTEGQNLMKIMVDYPSVQRFMVNRAAGLTPNGTRPYAVVPEKQMQQLQYVLGQAENPVMFTAEEFFPNQPVKVMRGPLAGVEGMFSQRGSASYIVIQVEMGFSNYAYTEVPVEDVQAIE